MGELTKTDNAGKNSPGPVYQYQDLIKYDAVSKSLKYIISYKYRHLDGQWELKLELEKISQGTISMKMHSFWMTQLKLIFQEKQDASLLKLELNQDSRAIIWNKTQVHSIYQKRNQFTKNQKNILSDIKEDKQ